MSTKLDAQRNCYQIDLKLSGINRVNNLGIGNIDK
jgi:hypothetical protein